MLRRHVIRLKFVFKFASKYANSGRISNWKHQASSIKLAHDLTANINIKTGDNTTSSLGVPGYVTSQIRQVPLLKLDLRKQKAAACSSHVRPSSSHALSW